MSFTICTPTFRGAARVVRMLQSTVQPYVDRVIVLDDGSPQEDFDALSREFPVKSGYFLRRSSENKGIVASYNELVRMAETTEIILLDDDAQLPLGFTAIARQLLALPNIGVLSWRSYGEKPGQSKTSREGFLEPATQLAGYCMAFRKSLWEELGGFDERFHHYCGDSDFALRATLAGHPSYRVWWPLVPHDEHQAFVENNLDRFGYVRKDLAAWQEKWSCDGVECEKTALKRLET